MLIRCAPTKIMLIHILKICFKIYLLNCFYAFENGRPPIPPPTKVMTFFSIFCLSACSTGKWGLFREDSFWGGLLGPCQLKMLVPPYKNPKTAQCPPTGKILATPLPYICILFPFIYYYHVYLLELNYIIICIHVCWIFKYENTLENHTFVVLRPFEWRPRTTKEVFLLFFVGSVSRCTVN